MANVTERKIGSLTIKLDRDLCISSAACIRVAPQVLALDSQQVVSFNPEASEAELAAVDEADLIEACEVCPVEAITAHDDDGEKVAP